MNKNTTAFSNISENSEQKVPKEKVMSYEEKTVGSTPFFKCQACPYMALSEDDMKFHLFTVHPNLAKENGLAVQIACPGCTSTFSAEDTLRTHLRNHHKMGIKDIKVMIKSLVRIALNNVKLKKENNKCEHPPVEAPRQEATDEKIPPLIEIQVPDTANSNNVQSLPRGVTFISFDELNRMSAPNFEKVDPKEIIQEASINIVYSNDISTQYAVSRAVTPSTSCNLLQVSTVTPDLLSSIPPRIASVIDNTNLSPTQVVQNPSEPVPHIPLQRNHSACEDIPKDEWDVKLGKLCSVGNCRFRMKDEDKLMYHRKCHQNGQFQCPECSIMYCSIAAIHTHLWKRHAIDMELATCDICGYKAFHKHRLYNIHMKCHGKLKAYSCSNCSKQFKNSNQLAKHRLIHKAPVPAQCYICQAQFASDKIMKAHVKRVHKNLKPYKCCTCEYTSDRKNEVNRHMRLHTGDKPYSCDQCIYRTADHNALRRHKKTHSNESVYKCKHCPYSTIQSTSFTTHMMSKHPNVETNDIQRCPFCPFKSVNKDKYIHHLSKHTDKEEIKLLIEIANGVKAKPSWTIPSEEADKSDETHSEQNNEVNTNTDNTIDVEEYEYESMSEHLPQDYSKSYTSTANNMQQENFDTPVIQDLSKDDNNSDCLMSESSNDTLIDRRQFTQLPLQMTYDNTQSNLHGFLNTAVSMEQNLLPNSNVNSLPVSHSSIVSNFSNNIMSNFPIRLPLNPQISVRNNITLTPVDKTSPLTKVSGSMIRSSQLLPAPHSSSSPMSMTKNEGTQRKEPKISVKSNLILKGPDQESFHSQQKMAFKQLEDRERFRLAGPVTFNNLITTQFMQLTPQPSLSESPNDIISYPQETLLDTNTPPVDSRIDNNSQIFSFSQQMNVNQMMLPPSRKIQTNDPSYIKLEATIKQNTQSPSLERMCTANLLSSPAITREYKASPPLEDIHKNMSEIKNEVKSDTYYNMTLNSNPTDPSIIDQYLIDNIVEEQYSKHLGISSVVSESDDQSIDVIEIDDNSDDNKMLPRFDMNFPLESLYLMHNDFHFLENEVVINNEVNEMSRMVNEVPIVSQKEMEANSETTTNDIPNLIQGNRDPMMNTSVRPSTNKINVKNIELMKN